MTVIVCAMLLVICLYEHHHKLMRNALCYIITTATIHEVMEIFQLHYNKLTGPPLYMLSVIDQNVVKCCLTLFVYYLVVCIGNMHLGAAGNHFLFFTFLFYSTSLWYFFTAGTEKVYMQINKKVYHSIV